MTRTGCFWLLGLTSKDIDFSENYCWKHREEIQTVHFGGDGQQVTLHTDVLYLNNSDNTFKAHLFCSLSNNNRYDPVAVWTHFK